jgi:hypothetical protein
MPLNIKGTVGCCKSETVLKVENLIVQFYIHFCQNIFFSIWWTVVAMSNKKQQKKSFFCFLGSEYSQHSGSVGRPSNANDFQIYKTYIVAGFFLQLQCLIICTLVQILLQY